MALFYQPDISDQFTLAAEEAHHVLKVLRLREGDFFTVTNGRGLFAKAQIVAVKKQECVCTLHEKTFVEQKNHSIHLAIAPTKNTDRMEWMVEKCVEIGVNEISFVNCQHSERKKINLERLQKVAISAMKQSQQAWLPVLTSDVSFASLVHMDTEEKFIAFVDSQNPTHLIHAASAEKKYIVLIGPEGDFSQQELDMALQQGFKKVSLGVNRLRTETAGIAAVHILQLVNSRP